MNAAALRDPIEELVSERKPNSVECEMVYVRSVSDTAAS
jgi:hypothetical protein